MWLQRVSLETLQKVAIYGAVISVTGSSILYYFTQRNICSGPYFTEAVAALRRDKRACSLLGEPVRVKALKLGDEGNWVTAQQAQVLIPISGSKTSGMLKSSATVRNGKWEVDSVALKFNNRYDEIVLIDRTQPPQRN